MPDDVGKMLRQESGPHSLAMTSYPDKAAQTEAIQRMALETIGWMWAVLIATALAGSLVWSVLNRSSLAWLVIVIIVGVLVDLLLPAVQSARGRPEDYGSQRPQGDYTGLDRREIRTPRCRSCRRRG